PSFRHLSFGSGLRTYRGPRRFSLSVHISFNDLDVGGGDGAVAGGNIAAAILSAAFSKIVSVVLPPLVSLLAHATGKTGSGSFGPHISRKTTVRWRSMVLHRMRP